MKHCGDDCSVRRRFNEDVLLFLDLLARQQASHDYQQRKDFSKSIRRYVWQQLRKRKADRFEKILAEFVDLDRLDDARRLPIRDSVPVGILELQPDNFASYLADVFKTDLPVQRGSACALLDSLSTRAAFTIQPFTMEELQYALRRMKNRKSSDEKGIVAEMYKCASKDFLTSLWSFYHDMLANS